MLDRVRQPRSTLGRGRSLPRHLHADAYATLVLEGGYEEAGEAGRWRVRPGEVLFHAPFSIHRNQSLERGARLVNLPIGFAGGPSSCGTVTDPDRIVRLAESDPIAAAQCLCESLSEEIPPLDDGPDRLARRLTEAVPLSIATCAAVEGVARQTIFRGFRALYGVSPTRYRVEARARRAWGLIMTGSDSLAEIALIAGFADQAHMSRDIKALTGRTPGMWAATAYLHHSFKAGTPRA